MRKDDFSKVEIKVSKVGGNVYMLRGAGGNIAFSVGHDGIVLVDDQFAPLADRIKAELKAITDKPVRFVINTHYHFDHTDGNAENRMSCIWVTISSPTGSRSLIWRAAAASKG
jgi:cyclase